MPTLSPTARKRLLRLAFLAAIVLLLAHHHRAHRKAAAANLTYTPSLHAITIAQPNDADTLDPSNASVTDTINVTRMLFGSLYVVSPKGEIQPYFADSFHYDPNGHDLTFHLRPGLRCENGSPFTARDVAFSFDRAADPRLKFTGNTTGFVLPALGYRGARVDDPLTVTLLLAQYNPIAVGLVSEVLLMCREAYESMSEDQASTHPVASGPYRLAEWLHDDRIVLERNPFFSLPAPPFDRVIWRTIPESSTRAAELIAGNVDLITGVAADQIEAIRSSDTAHIEAISGTRRVYVGFNLRSKFTATPGGAAIQNPAVRIALEYAVDVPTLCEALLRTPCKRMADPVVPTHDTSGLAPYPYDPDRAEKLLDAAGYPRRGPDGTRFNLTLQAPRTLYGDSNIPQAVAQYLSDIGVKTDVDFQDNSLYVAHVRQHDVGPLYILGTGGSTWSALYDMSDFSTPTTGTNYTSWSDPEFFAGWKELEPLRDPAAEAAVLNQMVRIFHDRSPWLFLYFLPDVYGVSNRLNWKPRADEMITLLDPDKPRVPNPPPTPTTVTPTGAAPTGGNR